MFTAIASLLLMRKRSFHLLGFLTGLGLGTTLRAGDLERFEVLLISRASTCEATARSWARSPDGGSGEVAVICAPLPLRAPRLRRLAVEVVREQDSTSSSSSGRSGSASSNSPSMLVESETSMPRWEGERESSPQALAGREDGRRERGVGATGLKWPRTAGGGAEVCASLAGRFLIQRPNSSAVTRCASPPSVSSRTQKTRVARNSATSRVMPVKRCIKKVTGSARNNLKEGQAPAVVSDHGL